MAKGYRPVARDQGFLLPPDMRDWLGADHPVWLVIEVAEHHLDIPAAHAARRTGGPGAAGYDPDMLVALLTWAYANRVTSSRQIEKLCRTDIAFRVVCGGGTGPDHATIARFRSDLGEAAEEVFAGVLVLCARLGMGALGVVALDGTKLRASASASANRTEEGLRKLAREMLAEHAAADAAEDALFGPGVRGDELPPELTDPGTRRERIAAALAGLEAERAEAERAEQAKAAEFRARRAAGKRTGPAPLAAAVELAQEKLDRAVAAQQARIDDWQARDAAARAAAGRGLPADTRPKSPASEHVRARQAAAQLDRARARAARAAEKEKKRKGPGPVRNITDPDSRLMPVRGGGFIQGYNAQNVTSEDGLIIATRLTQDTGDVAWFEPMTTAAGDAAALIGARRAGAVPEPAAGDGEPGGGHLIGLILADAGYLSEDNLTCGGPDRLIAVGKRRDLEKAARGGTASTGKATSQASTAMAARLKTSDGITAYRQRGHIAETPHGHIKHNMAFRQLSVRGKRKAAAEWTFTCAVHNLFKAITAGHLTSQALAGLPS